MNETIDPSISGNLGGYGNSANSLYFDFYNTSSGGNMSLMWEKLDLSATSGNSIVFDMAYAQYTSENDRLQIEVSTDCGTTWNSVYNKAGSQLSTRGATTSFYIPGSNDWRTETVDISSYDGSAELMVRFTGTSNYGNNLYVDNVQFRNDTYVGLEENKLTNDFRFYPNPADKNLNIEFELAAEAEVSIKVLDITGREVLKLASETLSNGNHTQSISVESLPAGTYFVELSIDGNVSVEKLMVK